MYRLGTTFFLVASTLAGCGTYTMVSPADTLSQGQVEVAAGLAASQLGEVNPVAHATVGVTDRIEVLGHYEIWNAFAEARFGLLKSERDGIALAVGVGGGFATTFVSELDNDETSDGSALTMSIAIGKRFGAHELALAHRTLLLGGDWGVSATRGQYRYAFGGVGVFVEVGGTLHYPLDAAELTLGLGEASFGIFFRR